jgi:Secretion system C-terminal sorting domain
LELVAFYNSHATTNLGLLGRAESAFFDYYVASGNNTSLVGLEQTLANAKTNLDFVSSAAEQWEINERDMQYLRIKVIKYGVEALSSAEIETIMALANSCVYTAGTATWIARDLAALWEPSAFFMDEYTCNIAAGRSPKGEELIDADINEPIIKQWLNVYPNPCHDFVNLGFECSAKEISFYLYDMFGRVIKSELLDAAAGKAIIDIQGFGNGIYTYKCVARGYESQIGKLTIKNN